MKLRFDYKATPQQIIKVLDKCKSHVQWKIISKDLDEDDITKLIQDGYLVEESSGYIRTGSKLRDYYRGFCKFTDELQDILRFKAYITKLNIAGEEWQQFMIRVAAKYQDKKFVLDYNEICRLTYYMSNLCSIVHSTRCFLQKHVLCKVCKVKSVDKLPSITNFPSSIDFIIFKNCVYYKDIKANEIKPLRLKGCNGEITEESIKAYVGSMSENAQNYFTSIGLCTNINPDKLIPKYSQFQNNYDMLNDPIIKNHLYGICSDIRNCVAHGGDIPCIVLRKQYQSQCYYVVMADFHKLKKNSTKAAHKKSLDKYYYNEVLFFIDAILQDSIGKIDDNHIDNINYCLQLALDDKNINVRTLSKEKLEKFRNDDQIKLYQYNNFPKNSLMGGNHWFNLSGCFSDVYTTYIKLYTELYREMRICNQSLISDFYSIGNLLKAELADIDSGGEVNIPDFDLQLVKL